MAVLRSTEALRPAAIASACGAAVALLATGHPMAGLMALAAAVGAVALPRGRRRDAVLERSAAIHHAILATTLDGIIAIDARGTVLTMNPAAERLVGRPAAAVVGGNIKAVMPEPYHSAHDGYLARYLAGGAPHIIGIGREVSVLRPDGSQVPVDLAVSEAELDGQRVFVGALRDLSERRKVEIALRELGAWQRAILDAAEFTIVSCDRAGMIQLFNATAERLLGWSAAEVIGERRFSDLHLPSELAARAAELGRSLGEEVDPADAPIARVRRDGGVDEGEWTYVRKDGTRFPVLLSTTAIRDAAGAVQGWLGIGIDLTQHRRAERNLDRFFAGVAGMLVIAGIDGRFKRINPAWTQVLGWTEAEMLGRSLLDFVHPDDGEATAAVTRRLTEEGDGIRQFRNRYRCRDGSWRTLNWETSCDRDLGLIFATAHDITELVETQRALAAAKEEAERALEIKSTFLATMSHEIRTPMNGVIGMANLLVKTQLDSQQREYAETVRSCGESLLTLINDVLDFSKMESGRLVLEAVPFNLRRQIEEVVVLFADQAERKGVEIAYHIAQELPSCLVGDPTRLRQVLLNLTANAVKFTAHGRIDLLVEDHGRAEGRQALAIRVKDTGIGMSTEQLARIGRPFEQADASTTRRFGGTGLGLSICTKLADLMGGAIAFESAPGRGTTATLAIALPIAAAQDPLPAQPGSLRGRRVLCVDDNPTHLLLLRDLCRSWGMEVDICGEATALLERLRRSDGGERPDLVITDHEMPVIDGVMLTRFLRSDPRFASVPVVVASSDPDRARADLHGLSGGRVMEKPLRQSLLFETLQSLFRPDLVQPAMPQAAVPPEQRLGRVLVAEDNPINQRLIRILLRSRADEVEVVDDGRAAVARASAQTYDCIFMDCQMPVQDGYLATREIRAREQALGLPRTPIIALTANAMPGDDGRCRSAGMDDYLSKPLRESDLDAALARLGRPARAPGPADGERLAAGGAAGPLAALRDNLSEDDFHGLVAIALETYPALRARLEEAASSSDLPLLGRTAHSMKGSAMGLGLAELGESCAALERAAKSGQRAAVDPALAAWRSSIDRTLTDLRRVHQEISP